MTIQSLSGLYHRLALAISTMVSTFNGRSGSIVLTKQDLDNTVSPNNIVVGIGVGRIIYSSSPPSNPQVGDLWIQP